MAELTTDQCMTIRQRAFDVCDLTKQAIAQGKLPKIMCPLNEAGRCLLYNHRPMICRLHGVTHTMQLPDGRILSGPGCSEFKTLCRVKEPPVLDRSPHYQAMAALEQALRKELGLNRKIKMTVAQMISSQEMG